MLASTMQFSNTNQTHPPHSNHLTTPTSGTKTPLTGENRFGSGGCLYDLDPENPHKTRVLSQDPTVCQPIRLASLLIAVTAIREKQ